MSIADLEKPQAGYSAVEPAVDTGEPYTDEPVNERASGSNGTILRGVLLVALGVASHVWIDGRRAVPLPPDVTVAESAVREILRPASETLQPPRTVAVEQEPVSLLTVSAPAGAAYRSAVVLGADEPASRANPIGTSGVGSTPVRPSRRSGGRADAGPVSVAFADSTSTVNSLADATSARPDPAREEELGLRWPLADIELATLPARRDPVAALYPGDVEPLASLRPASARLDVLPDSRTSAPLVEADDKPIRLLLERYQQAFNELDVRAASSIWPDVDRRALARAFSDLAAQSITLQDCGVTMATASAYARCRGVATYVPKVGHGPLRYTREWNFTLARTDDDWRIQSVH